MTVETVGAKQYGFTGQAPFIVQQFVRHGFIDVNIMNNGTKMEGKFYDNMDGKAKDSSTIIKTISVPITK